MSFTRKALVRIWFAVSLKLAGGFFAWKFPKCAIASAAAVLLCVPVIPCRNRQNGKVFLKMKL